MEEVNKKDSRNICILWQINGCILPKDKKKRRKGDHIWEINNGDVLLNNQHIITSCNSSDPRLNANTMPDPFSFVNDFI